jgi:uracil-DNA glycosylase family protein
MARSAARAEAFQKLRSEAAGCRKCPLWRGTTQTVFGEGALSAPIMLVGEQPGDREDMQGHPFVGPAGGLLDRALAEAGIERSMTYTTNVVKHFKYRMRGKRRIHQRPAAEEIGACRPWLEAELELVRPRVLVCLGATAGHALLGGRPSVERERGRLLPSDLTPAVLLTAHPSAALRQRDSESRRTAVAALVDDLKVAAEAARPAGSTR